MKMDTVVKGAGALVVLAIGYIDQTFSPLFWALLVLAALDILMNAHKEGQQFTKIGSAFVSVGGLTVIEGHLGNPEAIKIAVAVLVLAYLQVVVPQLLALLRKIKFTSGQKVAAVERDAAIAALETENARLRAEASAQLADPNPPKSYHV